MFVNRFLLLILFCIANCYGAKILCLIPVPGYSHHILGSSILTALYDRGHEITYVSGYPQEKSLKNWRDISTDGIKQKLIEWKGQVNNTNMLDFFNASIYEIMEYVVEFGTILMDSLFQQPDIQHLLHNPLEHFDVVIVENIFSDALIGLGYHFKCPVILLAPGPITFLNNYMFGSPFPSTYIPNMLTGFTHEDLNNVWNRAKNVYYDIYSRIFVHFKLIPSHNAILQKYLPNSPYLGNLMYNVSLMLLASHVSISTPTPIVPAIKEVGGYHIQKPKPLPQNIKAYLDNCTDGAIIFSMGSNIRSTDFSEEKKMAILNSFKKINKNVLWKFETHLNDVPNNVLIMNWLPQNDVLAHPNVIALINHGGLLSTTEAVYHGKPLIGIPVVWDQVININIAVQAGYAISVPYKTLTEDTFSKALFEIINNKKYTEHAKNKSKILHSEPIEPIKAAVFWIEYAIKFKGALHLKSPALNFRWYQIYMLDMILFSLVCFVCIYKLIGYKKSIRQKLKKQ